MTRPFSKDHFYIPGSARFTNLEKTTIEILHGPADYAENPKQHLDATHIIAKESNEQFQWVLKYCDDLESIHVNTFRWGREQRVEFEQQVAKIAKKEGLMYESGFQDVRFYKAFMAELFKPYDNEDGTALESLFAIKLELFEMNVIRQNTNAELKRALRRAETPIEVIRAAIEIHLDNVANGLQIEEEDTSSTNPDSA